MAPNMSDQKQIECFIEERALFEMRPSPHKRDWMDASPEAYAYRCLPLAIANAHGWDVLNPIGFSAVWDGGTAPSSIAVAAHNGEAMHHATSHFGEAVLTFHVPCLFKTPPGYDLYVSGPTNRVKRHIQPLTGVIETDWSPFSFTMNWIFNTPNQEVVFEEGEPIATFFPIKRGEIEQFTPVARTPEDDPELWDTHMKWRDSRANFNKELANPDSDATKKKWQKSYFSGPEEELTPKHRTKIRLRDLQGRSGK